MSLRALVDAIDLDRWANRRDAQHTLPRLVRRLVRATAQPLSYLDFPAGEGVHLGGWDGIVSAAKGNEFVPSGTSAWELSATKESTTKANSDYSKRRKKLEDGQDPLDVDPNEVTFVFVTPRRWPQKTLWMTKKRDEGFFRDVRAYDAESLEVWLESAYAVHVWLSTHLNKYPEAATDLESRWTDWSEVTAPPTSPDLVLAGRDEIVERITTWLEGSTESLPLRSDSRDESVAILAAAIKRLPSDQQDDHLSRIVVASDPNACSTLSTCDNPLIVIVDFEERAQAIARLIRSGHRSVVPLGRTDPESQGDVRVSRLLRSAAEKALTESGLELARARELAALASNSLASYRRKMAVTDIEQPTWAESNHAREQIPFLLVSRWNDSTEGDREIVAHLAQTSYEEVVTTATRWAEDATPPIRHVGDDWFLISTEESLRLVGTFLTRQDMERLASVALEVLGTPHPKFALAESDRWMASIRGHASTYSDTLSDGLAATLAAMGTWGQEISISAGVTAEDHVKKIVRQLLERASSDWHIWASLADANLLSPLAEAAPDIVLSSLDEAASGDEPILSKLFAKGDGKLHVSSPHTGLLWALETLAWSADFFGHAALVLAKLARIDPGGKLGNRPSRSLRDIFLPTHSQTTARLDQRLEVLDLLRDREPEVAWELEQDLLPGKNSWMITENATPRWRSWAPERSLITTRAQREFLDMVRGLVERMLVDAGNSGARWGSLIRTIGTLPPDQEDLVARGVKSIDIANLPDPDRNSVWTNLRELISDHRSFAGADWALASDRVDELDAILTTFEPTNPIDKYAWLFASTPKLPLGLQNEWDEHEKALLEARRDALQAIHTETGSDGLLVFAESVEHAFPLGFVVGTLGLLDDAAEKLLEAKLASAVTKLDDYVQGYVVGRIKTAGREWAEAMLDRNSWTSAQETRLLLCLPVDTATWDRVERCSPETQQQYWELIRHTAIKGNDEHITRGVRTLITNGRPRAALEALYFARRRDAALDTELVMTALTESLRSSHELDPPSQSFPHVVVELFGHLEALDGVEASRLATLEWQYLNLLDSHNREPKALHFELAHNPAFFVELLVWIFGGASDDEEALGEPAAAEQARAQNGYGLLNSWRTIPGTTSDGKVDTDALIKWVVEARELLSTSGLADLGDEFIGQVLSGSPLGDDSAWPHVAVRDAIERVASSPLEDGIRIGVINARGVVAKHREEGGKQERVLADRFDGYARTIRQRWPRTAAVLRSIRDHYKSEALREDEDADIAD